MRKWLEKWGFDLALTAFTLSLLAAIHLAARGVARAQHEPGGFSNAAQNYVSYPDTTLTGAASAVQVLAVNTSRVTAICQNTGATNSARVGDANTGAAQGTLLAAGAGVTLDATSAIYAYSAVGTTVNCAEIVRP